MVVNSFDPGFRRDKRYFFKSNSMQTILGAGGAIGVELAKVLPEYTDQIRLVSRNPQRVNPGDELFSVDLLDAAAVDKAVAGSKVVYLTVGLPYTANIWRLRWPVVMENTIQACLTHGAKLVFFDNIYMYDGSQLNPITEDLPINPPSKKGEVRAEIANRLWQAVEEEGLQACIARAADFYGPGINQTSVLTETVFKPLSEGKIANWPGNPDCKHSFTYTPDAGRATAILGNSPEAYGQAWHLPTAPNPPTGHEWVEQVAQAMDKQAKMRSMSKTMARIIGVFVPVIREMVEMMYQYEQDYVFDSSKFEQQFGMSATSYEEGIRQIVAQDYEN